MQSNQIYIHQTEVQYGTLNTRLEQNSLEKIKRIGGGLCFIIVPLVLIFVFAAHPNLKNLTPPGGNVDTWINEFHGNTMWRIAHLAALLVSIPIMVIFLELMGMLRDKAGWLSFVAGVMGIIGSFMLAADKGALALAPTAFDTLPTDQFQQMRPGLEAMIQYKGWMWMVNLYVLIFVGIALMGIALIKAKLVPYWQSGAIILGGLLFFNPDIDLISLLASISLAVGFIPMGISILKGIADN